MLRRSPGKGARFAPRARSLFGALAALAALAVSPAIAASARADALPDDYEPPVCTPVVCPEGSIGSGSGHGSCPSACVPIRFECAPDGTCAAGSRCVPTRFCLDMRPTGRLVQDVVLGECAADGSCAEGTCREVARCVSVPRGTGGPSLPGPREGSRTGSTGGTTATTTPAPAASQGGLCSVAQGQTLPSSALVVGLALGSALRRTRRADRRLRSRA